jgi:hypothetical protein
MASRTNKCYEVLDAARGDLDGQPVVIVLAYSNNKLWITGSLDANIDPYQADLTSWNPLELDLETIHSRYIPAAMTQIIDFDNPNLYLKSPDYLGIVKRMNFDVDLLKYHLAEMIMTREIQTCEILKRYPHPNVATYYGVDANYKCQVVDDITMTLPRRLVFALGFERYDCSLHDLFHNHEHINIRKVLSDVEAGIKHIHSLGLVHCDIKPDNIFVKEGRFVVGDFDSMHPVHNQLTMKMGTPDWYDCADITHAEFEHDFEALRRVKTWLQTRPAQYLPLEPTPYRVSPSIHIPMGRITGPIVHGFEWVKLMVQYWLLLLFMWVLPTRFRQYILNWLGLEEHGGSPYWMVPQALHNTRVRRCEDPDVGALCEKMELCALD